MNKYIYVKKANLLPGQTSETRRNQKHEIPVLKLNSAQDTRCYHTTSEKYIQKYFNITKKRQHYVYAAIASSTKNPSFRTAKQTQVSIIINIGNIQSKKNKKKLKNMPTNLMV